MDDAIDREKALLQAALIITSELSLDAVLQKLTDVARGLVRARYAALGVARADLKGLSRFVVSGVTHDQIESLREWPRGLGLLGALLQDPRPLRVRNIGKDRRSIGFPPNHPQMTSFLGVPIVSKGNVLGNFYLTDKIGADEFSQEDEDRIIGLAAFAAVAIENARLYTETDIQLRRKVQEVERAARQLEYLVELTALLPKDPDVAELPLEEVLNRATVLLGDACGVYLMDQEGILAKSILVHRDPARARAAEEVVGASWDAIQASVIRSGKSNLTGSEGENPAATSVFDVPKMREHRFSAAMAAPIRSEKQNYGLFVSLASQPLEFTPEDFSFGMLIAQRLATFIENFVLLRELNHALKTRDEFISIATHELKTPATVLVAYADLASRSLISSPEDLSVALDTIKKQSLRLSTLADELLNVARIRAGRLELNREPVDFGALLTQVVDRFGAQLSARDRARLKLDVPYEKLCGACDPLRLEQVMVNLLSNAVKYSPDGGDIDVQMEEKSDQIIVSVKDRGIGISKHDQSKVFEPFFRTAAASRAKIAGAGLGLHISKEIVERHGGNMWLESDNGIGTTFYFSIPMSDGCGVDRIT